MDKPFAKRKISSVAASAVLVVVGAFSANAALAWTDMHRFVKALGPDSAASYVSEGMAGSTVPLKRLAQR